jgi:hypothetical protein
VQSQRNQVLRNKKMAKKPGKIITFDEMISRATKVSFLPECQFQRQERNVTMCHNVSSVHVNQPCSKHCITVSPADKSYIPLCQRLKGGDWPCPEVCGDMCIYWCTDDCKGKGIDKPDLHPCPCDPACNCSMQEPCLGCETYGDWINERKK